MQARQGSGPCTSTQLTAAAGEVGVGGAERRWAFLSMLQRREAGAGTQIPLAARAARAGRFRCWSRVALLFVIGFSVEQAEMPTLSNSSHTPFQTSETGWSNKYHVYNYSVPYNLPQLDLSRAAGNSNAALRVSALQAHAELDLGSCPVDSGCCATGLYSCRRALQGRQGRSRQADGQIHADVMRGTMGIQCRRSHP